MPSDIGSAFGAFGSPVILMVWVYYSVQIFLLGAEFTRVYAHEHGSRRGEERPPSLEEAAAATTAEPLPASPARHPEAASGPEIESPAPKKKEAAG